MFLLSCKSFSIKNVADPEKDSQHLALSFNTHMLMTISDGRVFSTHAGPDQQQTPSQTSGESYSRN